MVWIKYSTCICVYRESLLGPFLKMWQVRLLDAASLLFHTSTASRLASLLSTNCANSIAILLEAQNSAQYVHCSKLCLTNLWEADALFRIFQGFMARWPNLCVSPPTQEPPRNCILKSSAIWHGLKYMYITFQNTNILLQNNTIKHCVEELWRSTSFGDADTGGGM